MNGQIIFSTVILLFMFLQNAQMKDTLCGVMRNMGKNGSDVAKETFGVWPWHVAVLNSSNGYVTSGMIISEWFVLTVAHVTFTSNSVQKTPNEFVVAMGIRDLSNPQNFTKRTNISSITRYEGYDQQPGTNDVALLKTATIITFNEHISNICFWPNYTMDNLINQENQMSIVGWGLMNENEESNIVLSETNVTMSNFEVCHEHSGIVSGKLFCIVNINKTDICLENGVGVIYVRYQDVWYLRGMISTNELKNGSDNSCQNLQNLRFMELTYHQKWIERYALPKKHNLLGIEDCGMGIYPDSMKQLGPQQQPWITQLAYVFWGRFNVTDCHGVLIHPEFVVTSSKCTENREYRKLLHVILGASSIGKDPYDTTKQTIQAIEITEHLFSQTSSTFEFGFDINVLRLARKADITDNVKPICLSSAVEATSHYSMVAWNRGGEHPKQLEHSLMQAIPFHKCHTEYLKLGINLTSEDYLACYKYCQMSDVQGSQTCVVDKPQTCTNPLSGGPLFYTRHDGIHTYTYLAGIRSFGPASCQDDIFEVFNDIVSFREEIETLVIWKAWFDEEDDHLSYDIEDVSDTVHFELDEEGNILDENGNIWNIDDDK